MTWEEGKMTGQEQDLGFAPEDGAPIPYMHRIREYYQTLGYGPPIAGHIMARCRFSR